LFAAPRLREICGEPFMLIDASRLMRFNRVSLLNGARAALMAACIDLSPRLGAALLRQLAQMRSATALAGNDELLADFVREHVTGTGHVSGTCRMGSSDDPLANCDATGRVRGVQGLRVADASIMPTVPSGNTHIPVIMVAEKLAAAIPTHPA
jgi:5-(hydroxymethyl)furfural/furfural oxidase